MADPTGREAEDRLLTEPEGSSLEDLAALLGQLAIAHGVSIATAESCTGGLVGHSITAVPGSSAYYQGGVISYADALKTELIGVPASTIERHGAVSAQVAVAMAQGIRERVGCDLAVAVTGVAGPDGGSDAKPVGLTYVATASVVGHEVRRYLWSGDRAANKEQSAAAALDLLIEDLQDSAARVRPTVAADDERDEGPGA